MLLSALHGVIPPVPTILKEDGSFDAQGMGVLIDHLLASEINAFLFLGSAGEFAHLTVPMRKEIAEFCIARVAGRRPVIIGTASCSTAEVIDLSHHATQMGADAVIVVNPYYALLTEDRIYQHYRQIAEAVELPVLLYNFPGLTGQDLSIELVLRLAQDCPNIVGIKDTVDCISHIRRLILEVKGVRPEFLVFCGFDEYVLDTLMLGGDGVIPATSNFAPEISCGVYKAYQEGDFATLQVLMRKLAALSKIYSTDSPFAGLVKEALCMVGVKVSTAVAAPATRPDAQKIASLVEILDRAGVRHS